jgi:hypothetical protein
MARHPAVTVERLACGELSGTPGLRDAAGWMMNAGLLLRTRAVPGWMDPAAAGPGLGEPLFTVQEIDPARTDLIVYN